ncbi:HAD family hydrolase [Pontibacter roseus]|uniref:HAD family hydrolase n=1 Tax=Pontibacter roseus TaxID=336989 RepID=UPI001FDEBED0|nr:HAD family hydrolase [Pontibacter roseus]
MIPPGETDFPTERRNVFQKLFGVERIRYKTSELFQHLKAQGHTVGIYTTSYRPKLKLRLHLLTYGINPDFIITEKENRQQLTKRQINCSKYPPAFNIDLHIDDSPGVEQEGQTFSFQTIIIKKDDTDWLDKVKSRC